MAIRCDACGEPVHEHAVLCPHCGSPTGVAPDPAAASEARAIAALPAPPLPAPSYALGVDLAYVAARDEPEVSLPRAVARQRRAPDAPAPPPADEAKPPEPVARTPASEDPRFLK